MSQNIKDKGHASPSSTLQGPSPDDPDVDSDEELWALVKQYRDLTKLKRQLLEEGAEDDCSECSDISQLSLITAQLEALVQLDEQSESAAYWCHVPGVTPPSAVGEATGLDLDKLEVPCIKKNHTTEELLADVFKVTESLKSCMAHQVTPKKFDETDSITAPKGSDIDTLTSEPEPKKSRTSSDVDSSRTPDMMSIKLPPDTMAHDHCFTPDHNILAAVKGKLLMYSIRGQQKCVPFSLEENLYILSVSVQPETSDVAFVSAFPRSELHVTSLLTGYEPAMVYSLPAEIRRVRFTADGNLIVGGFKDLLLYNSQGQELWRKPLVSGTEYMAVGPDGRIIISGSGQINTYDKDGNPLASCLDISLFGRAGGIATDSAGNLYVADEQNLNVMMFKSTGEFVRKVVSLSVSPRNLALHQDRFLTACGETGTDRIDVYDL